MYIGIDIGGTNTRIVTSESLSDVVFEDFVTFPTEQEFVLGLKKIIETIKGFECEVEGIGIGIPGNITRDEVLIESMNLPDWNNQPLKMNLENEYGCPVTVKNDGEVAALGEVYFGQMGQEDFLYITWGTGIGCSEVRWKNGAPKASRPVNDQPVYDLQAKIGGKDIEQRFGKAASDLNEKEWEEVMNDLVNDLPPIVKENGFDLVLIGGGVAVHQKDRLAAAAAKLSDVKLVISKLEGNAGLYGALALFRGN